MALHRGVAYTLKLNVTANVAYVDCPVCCPPFIDCTGHTRNDKHLPIVSTLLPGLAQATR